MVKSDKTRIFYGVRYTVKDDENIMRTTTEIITESAQLIPNSTYQECLEYDEYLDWFYTLEEAKEYIKNEVEIGLAH